MSERAVMSGARRIGWGIVHHTVEKEEHWKNNESLCHTPQMKRMVKLDHQFV